MAVSLYPSAVLLLHLSSPSEKPLIPSPAIFPGPAARPPSLSLPSLSLPILRIFGELSHGKQTGQGLAGGRAQVSLLTRTRQHGEDKPMPLFLLASPSPNSRASNPPSSLRPTQRTAPGQARLTAYQEATSGLLSLIPDL